MTKTNTASAKAGASASQADERGIAKTVPATPETALAARDALRAWMKARREQVMPKLTQLELSRRLGFPYSIVTAWENGTRSILLSQFMAWCQELSLAHDENCEEYGAFWSAILPDEKAGIATGSRMDAEVNGRLKELRKQLRFSLREMADVTGITAGHLQRIEANQSNISVAQLRNIHKKLKVSYEWLVEGMGEWNETTLLDELVKLRRENALLEELRQKNRKSV